jgi:hypothetical protein
LRALSALVFRRPVRSCLVFCAKLIARPQVNIECILNTGSVAMNSFMRAAQTGLVCCALLISALPSHAAGNANTGRSAGALIDDSAITSKVKAALIGDDQVKAFDINVDTYRGKVTLTGAVDTQAQIARAADDAQAIAGVKSVENRLTVKK